jgi:hypothetical protein
MNDALRAAKPPVSVRDRSISSAAHGQGRNMSLVPASPPALKARQLFREARSISLEHLGSLQAAIETVREMSIAVVEGGDLYAPGLNDFASRLSEDLFWRSKTLEMLSQRQRDAAGPVERRGPSPPPLPAMGQPSSNG